MQLLFDLFPVIAFFAAFKFANVFVATAVLLVALVVQMCVQWVRFRKISQLALISAALGLVFGSLTLILHNEAFIQWKLSIVDWLLAVMFAASRYIGDKTLLERALGEALTLDRKTWITLNWQWAALYFVLGSLNVWVMRRLSLDAWVNFKLLSAFAPSLALVAGQVAWLAKQGKLSDPAPAESAAAAAPEEK
jgi:intracellular septation protein